MTNAIVPYLAEMIDSYLTLHGDYLKTDSISVSEQLKAKLNNIEADMKSSGCKIIYSTEKWQQYVCSLPSSKSYQPLAAEILRDANASLESEIAPVIMELLRCFDNAIFDASGKRMIEQNFYAETDIIEIVDGNTLKKHVMFGDLNITQKLIKS